MAAADLDAKIDRLYQLPLDTFTAERNALAKTAGAAASTVRELAKPSIAAWAVNQLYWHRRGEWDGLVAAAENARRAHKAVLAGRAGDVRAAGKVHDDAVESALKATIALLEDAGHPATDATRQAVVNTLRAIPSGSEAPGRLTKTLQPGGFEMLAGLTVGRGAAAPLSPPPSRTHAKTAPARHAEKGSARRGQAQARAVAAARHAATSAERTLREAEQLVRREEFESARTLREERRAEEAAEKAREILARAKTDVERAEAFLATARRAREAAEARVPRARETVTSSQQRAAAAAAALKKLL